MYDNWMPHITNTIYKIRWFDVQTIISHLHDLSTLLYSKEDDAPTMIRRQIPSLEPLQYPATHLVRFPRNKLYICEAVGVWPRLLNELRFLTSLVVLPAKIVLHGYPSIDCERAAVEKLLHCIGEILSNIETMQDIFDRKVFEKRYKLVWIIKSKNKTTRDNNDHDECCEKENDNNNEDRNNDEKDNDNNDKLKKKENNEKIRLRKSDKLELNLPFIPNWIQAHKRRSSQHIKSATRQGASYNQKHRLNQSFLVLL